MDLNSLIKESAARIAPTMGDPEWLIRNKDYIIKALPKDWTSVSNADFQLRFGFAIKILGVEWREPFDIILCLYWLNRVGFAESRKDPHAAPGSVQELIIKRA